MIRHLALAAIFLFVAIPIAWAEDESAFLNRSLADKYTVLIGGYFAGVESSYQQDRKDGRDSSKIDLEQLGLDDDEVLPFLYGRVRFGGRWRAELYGFGTSRNATETENFDINLGEDGVIPVGVAAKTKFETNVIAARLGYSFVRSERAELGAGFGLHVTDFDLGISGSVSAGGPGVSGTVSSEADVTAPLPTVGVFGAYAVTDRILVEARAAYFSLDYDKYSGRMLDAGISLEHRTFKHVGFGAGWNYLKIELDVDESRKTEKYRVKFHGPMIYAKLGF